MRSSAACFQLSTKQPPSALLTAAGAGASLLSEQLLLLPLLLHLCLLNHITAADRASLLAPIRFTSHAAAAAAAAGLWQV
jgi:hypothetical protein